MRGGVKLPEEVKLKVTGDEPAPERSDRPVDQPPQPQQPGHESYAPPWADQPNYDPWAGPGHGQASQPTYGQPPGYDQYGQPAYPAYPADPTYPAYPGYPTYPTYPTYPGYPGYTVYPYPAPPYPYVPPNNRVHTQAIASLVSNIIVSLFCCPLFGIAGIVLSAIAMGRSDSDPTTARKLVIWSWGVLAASAVVGIALVVLLFVSIPPES